MAVFPCKQCARVLGFPKCGVKCAGYSFRVNNDGELFARVIVGGLLEQLWLETVVVEEVQSL